MALEFSRQIFEKYSNIKFHENPSSWSWVVPCGRTDGRTERHDEAKSLFAILGTRLKRSRLTGSIIYRKGTQQKTRANSGKLRWNSCYTGVCHQQIVFLREQQTCVSAPSARCVIKLLHLHPYNTTVVHQHGKQKWMSSYTCWYCKFD